MKRLLAVSLCFLTLAWVSPKTQASSVSTEVGIINSFFKTTQAALLAQDGGGDSTSTGSQTGEGGGGMQKIQKALYNGTGEDGGVFGVGLSWLRGVTIMFLGLYGVYLGISLAFGQADSVAIGRLFLGAMMALGAQSVSTLYTVLFSGEGG